MGWSLEEAEQALGKRAFAQVKLQVEKKKPAVTKKAPKVKKVKKVNPAEEALYVLLKDVFEPEYSVTREVMLCTPVGRKWRTDFVIEDLKTAVELDGWEFHGKYLNDFKNDREKDFEVLMQGYERIRIYASQALKEPGLVRDKLIRVKPLLMARIRGINAIKSVESCA